MYNMIGPIYGIEKLAQSLKDAQVNVAKQHQQESLLYSKCVNNNQRFHKHAHISNPNIWHLGNLNGRKEASSN